MSEQGWALRRAQASDLDQIKKLADAHKKELGFLLRPALAKSIMHGELFVAVNGEELVGFVHFHHRRDQQTTLYNIVVQRQFQRRGIGAQLIDMLLSEAKAAGKQLVLLKCPEDLPANHFYRKIGWRNVEIESGKARRLKIWQCDIK